MSEEKTIGVVGAGQMGLGIAQVSAQSGRRVLLLDQSPSQAAAGVGKLKAQISKLVQKGKLSEADSEALISRIAVAEKIEDFSKCDFVIEAASEQPNLKFELFKKLGEVCGPKTVLATNTSSISITSIAAKTKAPDRVAGMHFMNPVPVMKLVEGIRGLQTSDETFDRTRKLAVALGKTFVESKDQPGFIVNRVLMPMINEAVFALSEGLATASDIDEAMKLGTNQPMGPLALADFIGLDTCLAILEVLHQGLGDPKYRACPLLKSYVAAGWTGKKSGRGFYKYDG